MTRQEAMRELRLHGDHPSSQHIVSAYDRLSRRYPRYHFPERAVLLQQAREVLQHPERQIRDLLMADVLDLSWLKQYRKNDVADEQGTREFNPKDTLAALVRPTLLEFGKLEHEPSLSEIERELAGMTPRDLAEMMSRLGG